MNIKVLNAFADACYYGQVGKVIDALAKPPTKDTLLETLFPEVSVANAEEHLYLCCTSLYLTRDAFLRAYGIDCDTIARDGLTANNSCPEGATLCMELLAIAREVGLFAYNHADGYGKDDLPVLVELRRRLQDGFIALSNHQSTCKEETA